MMYVIGNGKNYITTDKHSRISTTTDVTAALQFKDKIKGENYLLCLPKSMKNIGYKLCSFENNSSSESSIEKLKEIAESMKIAVPRDDFLNTLNQRIGEFECFIRSAAKSIDKLESDLSNVDKEIVDIEHIIEFSTINAAQGYQLCKKLKDARVKRRKIKDALEIINCLLKCDLVECAEGVVTDKIKQLELRVYKPRILTDSFSGNLGTQRKC